MASDHAHGLILVSVSVDILHVILQKDVQPPRPSPIPPNMSPSHAILLCEATGQGSAGFRVGVAECGRQAPRGRAFADTHSAAPLDSLVLSPKEPW